MFNRQVANKLIFSDGIQQRSKEYLTSDELTIQLTALEDIFLFKTVAKRPDDIDDMNTLVQTSLDFEAIEREIETQIELLEGSDSRPISASRSMNCTSNTRSKHRSKTLSMSTTRSIWRRWKSGSF